MHFIILTILDYVCMYLQTLSFYFPSCDPLPPPVIMVQNVAFRYNESKVLLLGTVYKVFFSFTNIINSKFILFCNFSLYYFVHLLFSLKCMYTLNQRNYLVSGNYLVTYLHLGGDVVFQYLFFLVGGGQK